MNKQDQVNRFNRVLDQLLDVERINTAGFSGEELEMLDLAQVLTLHETRALSAVEKTLKQKLLNKIETKEGTKHFPKPALRQQVSRRRLTLILSASLVLFTLAFITVPPLRTFAEDIFHRIGNYILSNEPSDAEIYVAALQSGTPTATADPSRVCTACPKTFVVGLLTIPQASEKAGFPVYEAKYVPEGYQLSTRDVLNTGSSTTVDAAYRLELDPPLHEGNQITGILSIVQTLVHDNAQPWEKGVGDVPILEVSVRGQPGVWLEQIPIIPVQNEQGEWTYERWNQLIWAEDGYNFLLQTNMPSDRMPMDEMLKIAESLTK